MYKKGNFRYYFDKATNAKFVVLEYDTIFEMVLVLLDLSQSMDLITRNKLKADFLSHDSSCNPRTI